MSSWRDNAQPALTLILVKYALAFLIQTNTKLVLWREKPSYVIDHSNQQITAKLYGSQAGRQVVLRKHRRHIPKLALKDREFVQDSNSAGHGRTQKMRTLKTDGLGLKVPTHDARN